MFAYVLRRLLLMVPTTIGIALVIFTLYHAAPGDPATVMLGAMGSGGGLDSASDVEAKIEKFERKHGLDRSFAVQFLNYVGPFNLLRDGHPWFSSPYTERKVEEIALESGGVAYEGTPLEITHLPETAEADRARYDDAVAILLDAGRVADWDGARQTLAAGEESALPPLLNALFDMRLRLDRSQDELGRISGALEAVSGHTPDIADERRAAKGEAALVDHWFGWYFQNGGERVRNTGEKKWGGLLMLDLGNEMQRKTPVKDELVRRLKVTVPLSLVAVILSYLIALPLGIFSVRKQGTRVDGVLTIVLFVLYSIPTFWAGLMLILAFGATGMDWLPTLGLFDKDFNSFTTGEKVKDVLLHCILPVATLTYGSFAYLSRQMRAGMLDVIRQDYIRTARAKGLSERVVIYKHALRNSVIPVITLFASILPILIGGSVIVEKVFDIPGMGKYAFEGLLRRDFYVVMATTLFVGIMTQIGILLSDITYSLVDPRIRYD